MANAKELTELSGSTIGKVDLDQLLLDAVKRALEADIPPATNDNQLSWPLVPFPEGWHGG